jgi:hypothetical protein
MRKKNKTTVSFEPKQTKEPQKPKSKENSKDCHPLEQPHVTTTMAAV